MAAARQRATSRDDLGGDAEGSRETRSGPGDGSNAAAGCRPPGEGSARDAVRPRPVGPLGTAVMLCPPSSLTGALEDVQAPDVAVVFLGIAFVRINSDQIPTLGTQLFKQRNQVGGSGLIELPDVRVGG